MRIWVAVKNTNMHEECNWTLLSKLLLRREQKVVIRTNP